MANTTKPYRIKEDGLSVWLLRFSFGIKTRFNTYCEHFWLTVLAILLLPVIAPVKGLIYLIKLILKGGGFMIVTPIEAYDKRTRDKLLKTLNSFSKLEVEEFRIFILAQSIGYDKENIAFKVHDYNFYKKLKSSILNTIQCNDGSKLSKRYSEIDNVSYERPLYDKYSAMFHKKYYAETAEVPKPKPAIPKEPSWFKKVNWKAKGMAFGKYIAAPILITIAVAAVVTAIYYIYTFIAFLWVTYYMDWNAVSNFIIVIMKFIIFIVIPLFIVVASVTYGISKDYITMPGFIPKFFKFVGKVIGKIISGIGSVIRFIWDGIKLFKQDNCPPIEWYK